MARWKPESSVGKNEPIGRRLFDEPMLRGSGDQPTYKGLELFHFEEKRSTEISVDRLGRTGVDRKVTRHVLPRAQGAGRLFSTPKSFDGWAVVAAKEIQNGRKAQEPGFQIEASPVEDEEPLDNEYHGHIVRPDDLTSHMMALELRHKFTHYGNILKSDLPPLTWWERVFFHHSVRWLVNLVRK